MLRLHITAVFIGCLLDACFGDPLFLWHPVCGFGTMINWLEKKLRAYFPEGEKGERRAGTWLVILVLLAAGGVPFFILWVSYHVSFVFGIAVESILCYQMMAWHSLRKESMKVYRGFLNGDIEEARKAVSMIVGRDTKELTDIGITKAAVETVAENTSDGIIAPLISMVLFGGVGVYLYKAVNTMDSMVGYKSDRYLNFGRSAAKLDDLLNFIPARISAVLMIAAGSLCELLSGGKKNPVNPYNGKNGFRTWKRDRFNHKSPNSAQTESVCAGVLQIELAGNAWYFGKLYEKPVIGDSIRPVEYKDILRANVLMTVTYILAFIPVGCLFLFG